MVSLRFPKPVKRRTVKAAARVEQGQLIAQVRQLVFALDRRCAVCGFPPEDTDEMHEVLPRSKTRGRPAAERFHRGICIRICRECHHDVTEHRVELAMVNGSVDHGLVMQWKDDIWPILYRRGQAPSHVFVTGTVRRGIWTPEETA